ncbi:MAG: antitoxin [Limisphaerales bacterium]
MGRISIDVTDDEHKRLKAMAALRGKSIKDYVLERTLATSEAEHAALQELEELLDKRIRAARAGAISRRTASEVFAEAARRKSR